MFTGGPKTGIPHSLVITEPYDSLSFTPTILALTGQLTDGQPVLELRQKGFRNFPGRLIQELLPENIRDPIIAQPPFSSTPVALQSRP